MEQIFLVLTVYEDPTNPTYEADEGRLWKIQTVEEQEGQGGAAAKGKGVW